MTSKDVVIVGSGVIGLSIAYYLAKANVTVTVIDSMFDGQASAAAAGMLAPLGECNEDSPFVPVAIEALRAWPSFVDKIRAEVATDLAVNGPGMLRVAANDDEELQICKSFDWQRSSGIPIEMLCPVDIRKIEPSLSHSIVRAILSHQELHVAPRLLLDALRKACAKSGVAIINDTVQQFIVRGCDVLGVRTATATFSSNAVIVAGGSWSGALMRTLDFQLPVHPVRGQLVCFGPLARLPLKHTIYGHSGYLVPRPNGTLVAGATTEHVGFDSSTTNEGLKSLRSMAAKLTPFLADVDTYTSWAGLRPVSDDNLPLIGYVPGWNNVLLSTGHGRNGILLSPYTGSVMAEHLVNGTELPTIFSPTRFTANA